MRLSCNKRYTRGKRNRGRRRRSSIGHTGGMTRSADAAPSPRLDAVVQMLRERAERVTVARRAVLEVLDGTEEHLNADEIAARAAAAAPGLHRAVPRADP